MHKMDNESDSNAQFFCAANVTVTQWAWRKQLREGQLFTIFQIWRKMQGGDFMC